MTATTKTNERDRLFFQQQRALLGWVHETEAEAATLFVELRQRLENLDEMAESLAYERDSADIQHYYRGDGLQWLQQRLSEHVKAVRIGAHRLQVAAENLQQAASDAGLLRVGHTGRGYAALVQVARMVVASHRPDRELEQVPWSHVDAIVDGIHRLEEVKEAESRKSVRLTLQDHDRQQAHFRAAGLKELADRIDADPGIQLALRKMREFVGD